jgi:hypothetical protein
LGFFQRERDVYLEKAFELFYLFNCSIIKNNFNELKNDNIEDNYYGLIMIHNLDKNMCHHKNKLLIYISNVKIIYIFADGYTLSSLPLNQCKILYFAQKLSP